MDRKKEEGVVRMTDAVLRTELIVWSYNRESLGTSGHLAVSKTYGVPSDSRICMSLK